MPSPLTVKRNDYHARPKRSEIYTPPGVARFLFDILESGRRWYTILDPAIGTGRLTDPWYDDGCHVTGIDIVNLNPHCDNFILDRYEDVKYLDIVGNSPHVNLVLCNPPFNGAAGKRLYPEVFLQHTFDLFGSRQPIVLFAPMGARLNQRRKSTRWRWLRDCGADLTSIISLPLDTFPNVEFHSEILLFNIQGLRPHYFLPETAL